ncbi:ABC transporter permease [Qaidamihabitans albus]|uniref:ABC transporter permease n=1 Tax=Qaidamihabitans albus TaxID=2795733 RepID=UPI0018F1505C|nr:ABC transporter permease [Qaidamihabitans albus]
MWSNVRAEFAKHARRPANWLLLGIAATLSVVFAYLIPYAGLSGATSDAPNSERGLDSMLPAQFVSNAIGGVPVFVGALALIFGVLVVGSEYGWETWKSVLVQIPSRARVYGAKIITVLTGTLILVLTLLTVAATASVVVATVESRPINWPGPADLLAGAGGAWLASTMWASLGMLLAIALRSVALPVGLGLVWLLAVQNLLSAIAAPLLDWVADMQKALPGPNAGSLVASLGARPDTPGVAELVAPTQAALVLGAYLVAFTALGGWLLQRRDIH